MINFGHRGQRVGVDIRYDYSAGAACRKPNGGSSSDATCSTGHDDDFIFDIHELLLTEGLIRF